MSYLLIVVIGTVAGWVGGQFLKGNEEGIMIDLIAGAVGAVVVVLIARAVGSAAMSGYTISTVLAIAGAFGSLYATRRFMKARLVPAPRPRRRM